MTYHAFFHCQRDDEPAGHDAGGWIMRRRLDKLGVRYKSLHTGQSGSTFLNLSGTCITNLEPLLELPITHLCLQGCYGITDFAPLGEMRLVWLNLCRTRISNLAPVAGLPLSQLDLRRTRVTDLRPLKNTPLKGLDIRFTEIVDVSPLGCVPLERLTFYPGRITTGLDAIHGIKSLTTINRRSADAFWERNGWRAPSLSESWFESG